MEEHKIISEKGEVLFSSKNICDVTEFYTKNKRIYDKIGYKITIKKETQTKIEA